MGFLIKNQKLNLLRRIRDTKGLSATKLHARVYFTHGAVTNVLNLFEETGVIETRKEGRKRVSELTNKGDKILKLLEIVEERL